MSALLMFVDISCFTLLMSGLGWSSESLYLKSVDSTEGSPCIPVCNRSFTVCLVSLFTQLGATQSLRGVDFELTFVTRCRGKELCTFLN